MSTPKTLDAALVELAAAVIPLTTEVVKLREEQNDATAAELDVQAAALERRSDNVPMSPDRSGVERVATLRDIAADLRRRAAALRGQS